MPTLLLSGEVSGEQRVLDVIGMLCCALCLVFYAQICQIITFCMAKDLQSKADHIPKILCT